jgi:hypothetical protein
MNTSKLEVGAERIRAIDEALRASGARSLMELLAEPERNKEHIDKLCAKLEALPKVGSQKKDAAVTIASRYVRKSPDRRRGFL